MAGETRIIAFGAAEEGSLETGTDRSAPADAAVNFPKGGLPEEDFARYREEDAEPANETSDNHPPRGFPKRRVVAALAILAALGWTGFFAWARLATINGKGVSPAEGADLVSAWAVPVLLIAVAWLIVMRNSSREADRFGRAARNLSEESALLETRLLTVNRELSLAREFLGAQSRDLETLGRVAADRLSENADRLQTLIRSNDARVETISTVSAVALDNMEKLRGQLPVLASSAKDVANNIANAGRTAHGQLEDMIKGFSRINEFGQACDQQVRDLQRRIDDSLSGLSDRSRAIGESATRHFDALDARSQDLRNGLDHGEAQALAAMRTRAGTLAEEIEQTRNALVYEEEQVLISLRARLSAVRDEAGTVSRAIRDGEDRAQDRWATTLGMIGDKQKGLFEDMSAATEQAVNAARSRLEIVAIDAARLDSEIAERASALSADAEARRREVEQREAEAMERLGLVMAEIDAAIETRIAAHNRHAQTLQQKAAAVTGELAHYDARLAAIAGDAASGEERIAQSLAAMAQSLGDARQTLGLAESDLSRLTADSVRLLELIHATGEQCRQELPQAIQQSQQRLDAVDQRLHAMQALLNQAGQAGEGLGAHVEATAAGLKAVLADIEHLQTTVAQGGAEHGQTLVRLRDTLSTIEQQNQRIADKARLELAAAIEELRTSAQGAIAAIEEQGATSVSEIAGKLGQDSASAIDKAMRTRAAEAAGQLELAVAHASGVSREAAMQLRDQLAMVNELVGNLEQRVTQARERAEDQVDNDFSRRVALITESLNSNAIDIAKALSSDVSDTAWAAYLRGDRGIFTRRAVRLLDTGEMRAIQQAFERDDAFRDHVSRYIHDFEAILRQVLSTRDGNVIGVTLLSSDMGKLYVSLAQAIERLRT